jgi:O-antigen ligase
MTAPAQASAALQRLRLVRIDTAGLASWTLPFALVMYLGLKGGGYDAVVRGEIGVAVSWILLLGAAVGALPAARISRAGWVTLALLALFALWTVLGISWSESAERSVAEVGRVGMYLSVIALALAVSARGREREIIGGLASGVALISVVAALSRLHPAWFPDNETGRFLPGSAHRLSYPLNYWNGLAALVALGMPVVAVVACSARRLAVQGLAAAVLPAMALTLYLTASRGGAIALGVALLVLLALGTQRLSIVGSLLISGTGAAILIAAVNQRPALVDGAVSSVARRQGDEVIAMAIVVCAGVALLHVALALALRHAVAPRWLTVSPARARAALAVALGAAAIAVLATGMPGRLADSWQTFKSVPAANEAALQGGLFSRLQTTYGNGRYQYWLSADAATRDRVLGRGPGTFEFWWARDGSIPSFVRNAHSLYLETWAELGFVGLLLLFAAVLSVIRAGIVRALLSSPASRLWLAGATSACCAFATSAAFDWVWQIAVLPVAFLLLAAVILNHAREGTDPPHERADPLSGRTATRGGSRLALGLVGLATLVMVAIPLAGAASLRQSQAAASRGDVSSALASARTAADIQPYAATPKVQLALLLERTGDLTGAARAAEAATRAEATNWRTWLTLSRIEAERGRTKPAVAAYRKAFSLNPRSTLLAP